MVSSQAWYRNVAGMTYSPSGRSSERSKSHTDHELFFENGERLVGTSLLQQYRFRVSNGAHADTFGRFEGEHRRDEEVLQRLVRVDVIPLVQLHLERGLDAAPSVGPGGLQQPLDIKPNLAGLSKAPGGDQQGEHGRAEHPGFSDGFHLLHVS